MKLRTFIVTCATGGVICTLLNPAHAETAWSFDYDLSGIATDKGVVATFDSRLAYAFDNGRGHVFLQSHLPLQKPQPLRMSSKTTMTTETIRGACSCVTINNTFSTTVEGYVAYDDFPSARFGVDYDFSPNVTGTFGVEGVRKGPAQVFVQLDVHSKGWRW